MLQAPAACQLSKKLLLAIAYVQVLTPAVAGHTGSEGADVVYSQHQHLEDLMEELLVMPVTNPNFDALLHKYMVVSSSCSLCLEWLQHGGLCTTRRLLQHCQRMWHVRMSQLYVCSRHRCTVRAECCQPRRVCWFYMCCPASSQAMSLAALPCRAGR